MSKPLTIVIPMAGQGSRFVKAGWGTPKPLITFCGKMMIEHVMDSFPSMQWVRFVLIVREDFLEDYQNEMKCLIDRENVSIVVAKKITQGAACSVLLAREYFKDSSLLVVDSDTFYQKGILPAFLEKVKEYGFNLGLITFKSDEACYSYIKLSPAGYLDEIAEKKVISKAAISGVYYFSDGSEFEKAVIESMVYDEREKGEFYLSSIFGKVALKCKQKILLYEVPRDDIFCAGTPQQLEETIKRLAK